MTIEDAQERATEHLAALLATQEAARIVARAYLPWQQPEYAHAKQAAIDAENATSTVANVLYRIFDETIHAAICEDAERQAVQAASPLALEAFDANLCRGGTA